MTDEEIQQINNAVVHPIEIKDTDAADLIIADEEETPIVTFKDGHIKTANFDSANIAASAGSSPIAANDKKMSQLPLRETLTGDESVPFSDGNANGCFKMSTVLNAITEIQQFATETAHPVAIVDTDTADLIIADEKETPIVTFKDGHIKTANFDSANIAAVHGITRLRLMHWNVGHWAQGQSTDSAVTPENLSDAKRAYSNLLNEVAADIVAMCEYEPTFCGNLTARSALFSNYRYHYQAPTQSGYIGTAFASVIKIDRLTEYSLGNGYTAYEGRINIGSSEIVIVECHCPWQSQLLNITARDILIRRYADTKNVIIAGDMNIYADTEAENADVWQEAGYMMANWGVLGNITTAIGNVICSNCLDNILIKGGSLVHTRTIETNLSDHYPLITEITFN